MALTIGNKLKASSIALGCMRMASLGVEEAEKVVMKSLEKGINFFDHADIYGEGESERVFGQVLKRNPQLREKIIIQDKCGICKGYYDLSKEHIISATEKSLKRLGVEYLDLLLLHRPDALMEPEEIGQAFTKLSQEGKVRFFGVSNMNSMQMEFLSRSIPQKIVINQLQFGLGHSILIDEGISVNTKWEQGIVRTDGVIQYCQLNNINIQAWSPLQHGMFEGPFLLSDKYEKLNNEIRRIALEKGVADSTIAIAWILRHSAKIQPIIGTMNIKRIKDIMEAEKIELTRKEWYTLYNLAGNPIP